MFDYASWVLLVVLVFLTVPLFIKAMIGPTSQKNLPYQKRKYLLTEAERSFLGVLELAITSKHRVCVQVRLADVITVKKGLIKSIQSTYQNKINSKHLDFVVCDADTLQIRCAIELDDASHKAASRKIRDRFINTACKDAGLILLRVPAKTAYTVDDIRSLLDPVLFYTSSGPGDQTKISDIGLKRTEETTDA